MRDRFGGAAMLFLPSWWWGVHNCCFSLHPSCYRGADGGGAHHGVCCRSWADLRKPRLGVAEAIYGEGHRSVLWRVFQRYFFLLICWRIIDLGEGNFDAVVPSGLFPGDGGGALASRCAVVGNEDEGPDHVFSSYLEVLFVILENASVISLFFGVLLVILYQPH